MGLILCGLLSRLLFLLGLSDRLAVIDVLPLFVGVGSGVIDVSLAGEADEVASGIIVTDDLRGRGLGVLFAGSDIDERLIADAEHEVTDLRREILQVSDSGVVARPQVNVDEARIGIVHTVEVQNGDDGIVLHLDLLEGEAHPGAAEKLEVLGSEVVDVIVLSGLNHGTNSFS